MSSSGAEKFKGKVEVLTWGSHPDGGNGLLARTKKLIFGGNLGHAALRISVPFNEYNKDQIDKYCTDIPYTLKKLPNGEKIYEIYLSAWGTGFNDTVAFKSSSQAHSYIKDSKYGRKATHFQWNTKWVNKLGFVPEKRRHRGLLPTGETVMTYGPASIIHLGNLEKSDPEKYKKIQKIEEFKSYKQEEKGCILLTQKLLQKDLVQPGMKHKTSFTLSTTEKNLLDRYVSGWQEIIANPSKLSIKDLNKLRAASDEALATLKKSEINIFMEGKFKEKEAIKNDIRTVLQQLDGMSQKNYSIIPKELKQQIQEAAKYFDPDFDWGGLNLNANEFSKDEINTLKTIFQNEFNARKRVGLVPFHREWIDEEEYNYFATIGAPPDAIITLPIKEPNTDSKGLDFENMLKEAKRITDSDIPFALPVKISGFFSALKTANCSKVANWILKAGTNTPTDQKIFENEALGFIGTPQIVFNNAVRYQSALHEKKSKNVIKNQDMVTDSEMAQETEQKINLNIIEIKNDIPEKALDTFEEVIKGSGTDIPTFHAHTYKILSKAIEKEPKLKERYFALCTDAIKKVNKESLKQTQEIEFSNQGKKENLSSTKSRLSNKK